MKAHIFLSTILALVFFPLVSFAGEGDWNIETDSRQQATLAGTGVFKDVRGQAWLSVSCSQDDGQPFVLLRIENALAESFPAGEYEGPGGLGEELPLLLVAVDKGNNPVAYFSSGTWQDKADLGSLQPKAGHSDDDLVFQWEFSPSQADVERWLNAPNSIVTVYIQQKENTAPPLEASFLMPSSSGGLLEILASCGKK